MASGLIILFSYVIIYEKIDIESILIITDNFSLLIRKILTNLKELFFLLGIVLIIIGIMISIIKSCVKQKKKVI